ncbi:transglycosylase family protein [Streptomyces sp. NPDC048057]|uniref:transglycosylase family protein n=1 Tax=Streptomyces sp. NPDC048057 TaxID=3155628 RepID=UPI0033DDC7E1
MSAHSRPSRTHSSATRGRYPAALVGAALVAPLALVATTAGEARAADNGVWDRIAQCESGGNWHINTGNGYYGGLQFSASTWKGFGGGAYARSADKASKSQQIAIATKVQRVQGWGAWPTCSRKAGAYGSAPASAPVVKPAKAAKPYKAPKATSKTGKPSKPNKTQPYTGQRTSEPPRRTEAHTGRAVARAGTYTVRQGDTLSGIAAAHGKDWRDLHRANSLVVGADPNLILPGQRLAL